MDDNLSGAKFMKFFGHKIKWVYGILCATNGMENIIIHRLMQDWKKIEGQLSVFIMIICNSLVNTNMKVKMKICIKDCFMII